MKNQLLLLKEVAEIFRKSERSILRYEQDGLIPLRLNLPGRQALWSCQDIDDFIESVKNKNKKSKKIGAPTKNTNHFQVQLVQNTGVDR